MEDEMNFDFEGALQGASPRAAGAPGQQGAAARFQQQSTAGGQGDANLPPGAAFQKNWRQTVCTYWLRGLCMRGDQCGFLHQYDKDRMPVCRAFAKTGVCHEADCPYKHTLGDIKECNMYKLGFCVYGPHCRYRHTWKEQQARQQQEQPQLASLQTQQPQQPLLAGPQQQHQQQHGSTPMLALPAPGMGSLPGDAGGVSNGTFQPQQQQQQMRPLPPRPPPGGPPRPMPQPPPGMPALAMSGGVSMDMGLVGDDGLMEHLPSPLMFAGVPGGINLPPPFLAAGMQQR